MPELHRETIPARAPWSRIIKRGETLRIIDTHGQQAVDFLCYNAHDFDERYHEPNTIKKAGHILLTTGDVLSSDRANPRFTIVADSFGGHDTIGGCCSEPSNRMLYGVANVGCRENFLTALKPHGLGWRDVDVAVGGTNGETKPDNMVGRMGLTGIPFITAREVSRSGSPAMM